jgi:hypothetical protein
MKFLDILNLDIFLKRFIFILLCHLKGISFPRFGLMMGQQQQQQQERNFVDNLQLQT